MRPWLTWEIRNLRAHLRRGKSRRELADEFGRSLPSINAGIWRYCPRRDRAAIRRRADARQAEALGQTLTEIRQDNIRIRCSNAGWPQAETDRECRVLEALWANGPLPFGKLLTAVGWRCETFLGTILRKFAAAGLVRKGFGKRGRWEILVEKWSGELPKGRRLKRSEIA